VAMLQWSDSVVTPTLSDGTNAPDGYSTVVNGSGAEFIRFAYWLSSPKSGTVTYTWTATGGGGHTAHVFEMSGGSFLLDTVDAGATATSGTVATSANETSAETSMVGFGGAGWYNNRTFVSATLDGVAVDQNASAADNTYLSAGMMTMRVMNNPGTYNSAITASSDSLWVADLIAFKAAAGGAVTGGEALSLTDSISRSMAIGRSSDDSISLSDAIAYVLSGGGTTYNRYLAEALGLTDAELFSNVLTRYLSESVGATDYLSRAVGLYRALSENEGTTDALGYFKAVVRSRADSVGATDSAYRSLGIVRQDAESIGVSDARSSGMLLARIVADALGVTDATLQQIISNAYVRAIAESVGTTDAISRIILLTRAVAESCGVTDARTIQKAMSRALSEALGIADATYQRGDWKRYPYESAAVSDASTSGMAFIRKLAESAGITDAVSISTILVILRYVGDALGVTDARFQTKGAGRYLSESVGVTDARSRIVAYGRALAEDLGITDFERIFKQMIRSMPEGIGVGDSQQKLLAYVRKVADTYGISDSALAGLVKIRSIFEMMGVTDKDVWQVLTALYVSILIGVHEAIILSAAKSKRITLDSALCYDTLSAKDPSTELAVALSRINLEVE
jgi:PAS domain-containing protein